MSLLHAKYAVYISPCHEIHQISCMKSARFHGLPLNPVFFIRTNTDIHERTRSTTECCIFGSFGIHPIQIHAKYKSLP